MKSFYSLDMLESQVFGDEPGDGQDMRPEEEMEFEISEELSEELKDTEPIFLTVTMDGGIEAECRVAGVFLEGEREYIALELPDGGIEIMRLEPGEDDGIQMIPVEEEEEQERAIEQFIVLFNWGIPEEEFAEGPDSGEGQSFTEEQNTGEDPVFTEEQNAGENPVFTEG